MGRLFVIRHVDEIFKRTQKHNGYVKAEGTCGPETVNLKTLFPDVDSVQSCQTGLLEYTSCNYGSW
jgi:hypothetical protein